MRLRLSALFLFIITFSFIASAQSLIPRVSPLSKLTQTIGISDITVTYSRPAVKGRVIWGELVPYDKIWRVGANENTTVQFPEPVTINGKSLAAGTYGNHMLPGKDTWTVIFSKDTQLWGDTGYKGENDALRLNVKPVQCEMNERLTFDFEDITDGSASLVLKWEKTKISVPFTIDTKKIVLDNIGKRFSWSTANSAATYILSADIDPKEGLKWSDYSIMMQENYQNLKIKAQLLAKSGDKKAASEVMEKALSLGNKMANKPYDIPAMEKLLNEWKSK